MRPFRRQPDEGMWAAMPVTDRGSGRREAVLVTDLADVPPDAETDALLAVRPVALPPPGRAGRGGELGARGSR